MIRSLLIKCVLNAYVYGLILIPVPSPFVNTLSKCQMEDKVKLRIYLPSKCKLITNYLICKSSISWLPYCINIEWSEILCILNLSFQFMVSVMQLYS